MCVTLSCVAVCSVRYNPGWKDSTRTNVTVKKGEVSGTKV